MLEEKVIQIFEGTDFSLTANDIEVWQEHHSQVCE